MHAVPDTPLHPSRCTGQEPVVVGKPAPLMIDYLADKFQMDKVRSRPLSPAAESGSTVPYRCRCCVPLLSPSVPLSVPLCHRLLETDPMSMRRCVRAPGGRTASAWWATGLTPTSSSAIAMALSAAWSSLVPILLRHAHAHKSHINASARRARTHTYKHTHAHINTHIRTRSCSSLFMPAARQLVLSAIELCHKLVVEPALLAGTHGASLPPWRPLSPLPSSTICPSFSRTHTTCAWEWMWALLLLTGVACGVSRRDNRREVPQPRKQD